jgi:uncharacterized protein YeeX (DUF496 family)
MYYLSEAINMRKIQPVSFSLSDPFEQELYQYAINNGAFSKYIKRLIQRDMERRESTKKAPAKVSMTQLNGMVL